MDNLKRCVLNDNSSITVNYKRYDSGIWVYCSKKFENEKESLDFLEDLSKDFNRRLLEVEKRTLIYEKFKPN